MKGREAQSQLGKTGAYGETDLDVAQLGFVLRRVLSREPIGARNGSRELELQAASARRLAELKLRSTAVVS